jgi:uncharacterized protein YkwD
MLCKIRPEQSCAALIRALVILAFTAIIPETFAQTPKAPVAILISSSTEPVAALRSRRVSAVSDAKGPAFDEANEIEKRAFEMTNAAREEKGLPPLVWAPDLCTMARAHSENMVRRGFFAHETPDGLRMVDRAHLAGIGHFKVLGENIAYNQGFDDPGGFAVERWMLSPGHRANILNREFLQSAIGVFVANDGTVYLTQEFIAR